MNDFRWLNEGRQRQLGSTGGVEQLSSVTPGQSRLSLCGSGPSSSKPDDQMAIIDTKKFLVGGKPRMFHNNLHSNTWPSPSFSNRFYTRDFI